MTRFTALLFAFLSAIIGVGCAGSSGATRPAQAVGASVEYRVSIPDVDAERFRVEATLYGLADDTLVFHFPVWAPGASDIVDFGAYVSDFTARAEDGRALTVLRTDTNTFRIVGTTARVELVYTVDDIEHLPNSAWFGLSDIEEDRVFANGTALFGYPAGHKEIPYAVTYEVPRRWEIAVALDRAGTDDHRFVAAGYDELVDAPVQMGAFQRFEFAYKGVPHVITVTAPERLDDTTGEQLVAMTRRVVEAMTGLFGDIPYERYLFQHYLVDMGATRARGSFGALEHAASSTYRMPYYGQDAVASSLASVVAHEFWHLWIPKRIHVHQLGPFDYQKGPETTSLWFAEGLTEYYARAINARIGLSTPGGFLREFQSDLSGLIDEPQAEPMTELSRRIVHAPMTEVIDLYKKGPLLGYLLDAEIRWQTKNARSLDDAMRHFNAEYGRTGRTFSDDEIIPIMERATGASLGDFHRRYIAGRDTLPFREAFARTGLRYVVRDTVRPAIGAVLTASREGARISRVLPGGSAERMELRVGDVITTLDFEGYSIPVRAVPLEYLDQFFANEDESASRGGEPVYVIKTVSVMRDGRPVRIPATVTMSPSTVERLEIDPSATGLALEVRRSMLGF